MDAWLHTEGARDIRVTPPAAGTASGAAAPASTTTGVPDRHDEGRVVRVFLSSTFRDMQGERDALASVAVPALKRRLRARGVELLVVDLRWGVTEPDVTIETCLSEVERCRPWFIGILGQRYGTVLGAHEVTPALQVAFPVMRDGAGRSLTELEILHGVLNRSPVPAHALFFRRDPSWLDSLTQEQRAQFEEPTAQARAKLADLEVRIRNVAQITDYAHPADIAPAVEAVLGALLDARFPEGHVPNAFIEADRLHAAYARERLLGPYVGGGPYFERLDEWMAEPGAPPLLITGASGGGKSALLAHWLHRWHEQHPRDILFAHHLGASPDSADPLQLLRRLWEHLNRATGESVDLPTSAVGLMDLAAGLAQRLAQAALHAERQSVRIVIALDGIDKLSSALDLRWLPSTVSSGVKFLASSPVDSDAARAALERGWSTVGVAPLDDARRRELIAHTLALWGKRSLPQRREVRILRHGLAGLPLFLRTVLDELRFGATEDVLDERLDDYLTAADMPGLFDRVLARLERDYGGELVERALSLVWAGRAGLEESEIIATCSATPLAWARLRNGLGDSLRDQTGRIDFSHEFLRAAVAARYLSTQEAQRAAHLQLAARFEARKPDARQAEELPYQLRAAQAWDRLEALLLDLDRFQLLRGRGDEELLGYWLPLVEQGRDLVNLLCCTFEARAGDPEGWNQDDASLANVIQVFLGFARAVGEPLQRLDERLVHASHRLFGPEHPITLAFGSNLASTLRARGDLEGAKQLGQRVLEAEARSLGPVHPDTLMSANNLAETLRVDGDPGAAQQLWERVLAARERLLGPGHPLTLRCMNNLGLVRYAQNDRAQAHELWERALTLSSQLHGPEHPETLLSMSNVAESLRNCGDLRHAQELQERVLGVRMRLLGPEHPYTLGSMNNLALIFWDRGNLEGAQQLHERVLAARRRVLGPENYETLEGMRTLATLLYDRGDLAGAQLLEEQALDAVTRRGGAEHPDALTGTESLAALLHARGDLEGAQRLQERVLEVRTRRLGPEDTATLAVMGDLARTRRSQGDLMGAKALQERLLEIMMRLYGPRHADTVASMNELAATLHALGDLAGAHRLQGRALEGILPRSDPAPRRVAQEGVGDRRAVLDHHSGSAVVSGAAASDEQERLLAMWRKEWLNIGVCTQLADRRKAECAITALYARLRRRAPRFLWRPSPAAALAEALRHSLALPPGRHALDRLQDSCGGDLMDLVWDPLKWSLNATLKATIADSTGERVHDMLWRSLQDSIEDALFIPLRDSLQSMLQAGDSQVLPAADDRAADALLSGLGCLLLQASGRFSKLLEFDGTARQLHWAFGGQHDVHWIAFYLFCEQVLGVRYEREQRQILGLFAELCETGWWVPYDTWCICVDRPAAIDMERLPDPRRLGLTTERFYRVTFRDGTGFDHIRRH
jgi:hypothetical protein